ncbi:low molecular weight protein arginine phosphatase [Paenibacillus silviterrae]|uniref:low molecular weight protein arginine phosphatase n=1 Tax=Paenibacillus silviterrae TaxID=3242194 RepID=UPI002542CE3D|nr:low molecular weight protein arginine phosphatase [Paenibacillus chinjuensis]
MKHNKRILFVCTGNTCRSPMAEGMMRLLLQEQGLQDMEVRSAGVAAYDGTAMSDHAATILKEKGFGEELRSTQLNETLVDWADLILTMTNNHKRHTIQLYPHAVDKVATLKEYVDDKLEAAGKIAEMNSLLTELQLKRALAQPVTDEERARLMTLERELPNQDIADPFGGPVSLYRQCAVEIEEQLHKLVRKLKQGGQQ